MNVTFYECTVNVVIVILTLLLLLYVYYQYALNYWYRRTVPYVPGTFPFGSFTSSFIGSESFTQKINEFYRQFKAKGCDYVGLYITARKALLVLDPSLVKRILTTDFQYFHDRGVYHDETNDPLSAHLVALSGDQWKDLRQKLTPTFSSGKLKTMFHTVLQCAEQLSSTLAEECVCVDKPVEMKDLAARYTTDVIGSCAFGIECNSLKNPEAQFRQIGRKVFLPSRTDVYKRAIIRASPWLAKKLKIKVTNSEVSKFFIGAVKETVEYRIKNNISRGDFLQLLIGLMNKEDDGIGEKEHKENSLTMNQVAAQTFVFFLAGFETSASTMTFALYELAIHTDIQERVRTEITEVVKKYNDSITYDAIMEMHYTEKVLQETMRKYPTFVLLMRKCTKDYKLPNTDIILQKGTAVIIPVQAIQNDPEFYPDPEKFDPNRFDLEEVQSRVDHTYIPFGSGPRICIGLRFAMIQMKVAITMLLLNYKFTLNEKTGIPLVMNPATFILTPQAGTWLNVSKINPHRT